MANDDYFVIVYKILEYLYQCMKAGRRPMPEDLAPNGQMYCIPETYWTQIMEELIDQGYVKGIAKVPTLTGTGIKINPEAAITMKGVEFLQTNSKVEEAKRLSGKAFQQLLNGMIAQLPAVATMMGM